MILNEKKQVLKNGQLFKINGKVLEVGSKVLVPSKYGDYKTKVVLEGYGVVLEENLTVNKDNYAIDLIKEIL